MLKLVLVTNKQLQEWPPHLIRSVTKLGNGKFALGVAGINAEAGPSEASVDYRIYHGLSLTDCVMRQLEEEGLLADPAPKVSKPKKKAAPKKKPAAKKTKDK